MKLSETNAGFKWTKKGVLVPENRFSLGHTKRWGKRGFGEMVGQFGKKSPFSIPKPKKETKVLWYMAVATTAGVLLLFSKLKKVLYRYLSHFMAKSENKDKALRTINEAVVDISVSLGPKIRPLVHELRSAHESGALSQLSDQQLERYVGELIERKFAEASPIIDRELEKIVPKLRKEILSGLRNEFIVFLFSEGIVR